MTYLLDTNSCIKYLNGSSESVRRHLESAHPRDIFLCSVVKAELLYGAMKSARIRENLSRIQAFSRPFISLPFDDEAAGIYSEIRAQMERLGTLIGPNALLIASIALAREATLVTHNTREFGRVQGLKLEDWE